ncbi:hypothetical protein ScPMuIL_000120, partial [Solemya velum]
LADLSKFLLRKDLLMSRHTRFNDRAESFPAWKTTFCAVIEEIRVTPSEELDLLCKWLGPESARHAQSIRSSSVGNHAMGLRRLWQRLEERYGSAELIEASLRNKLSNFQKINYKDKKRLYELCDVLTEIQSLKEDSKYEKLLSYFDTSAGVIPIVSKLPSNMQYKWRDKATSYKKSHDMLFPPFTFLIEFLSNQASMLNDPGFTHDSDTFTPRARERPPNPGVFVNKVDVKVEEKKPEVLKTNRCVIHNASHKPSDCLAFQKLPMDDKWKLLQENNLCFRCCNTDKHRRYMCKETVKCAECNSDRHVTAMHVDPQARRPANHGGESSVLNSSSLANVTSKCTEICFPGKSCAKIVLVDVTNSTSPGKKLRSYAILDEQSNKTLARKELFDAFDIQSQPENYNMSSCGGKIIMSGRRGTGFCVEALDGNTVLHLPTVIECDEIPNNREEIPTPEVAMQYSHLQPIADKMAPFDPYSEILLLIGRDQMEAHHVIEQTLGPSDKPYAQKLRLGWVVVGETCLGQAHAPTSTVSSMKTYLRPDDRASIMMPCESDIHIREVALPSVQDRGDLIGHSVFRRTENDDDPGLSIEDKAFLECMDKHFATDDSGSWIAPLPFRASRPSLPNNRALALHRAKTLETSLKKDAAKKEHLFTFMETLLDSGHAEKTPQLKQEDERWYLPLFGVYHPKKKDRIRGVFDSSAQYNGISLNDVLLSGPDLTNSLVGVLMRFRKECVGITADIQQMFYCFLVTPEHRDYLRFLWYEDNDFEKGLVDYRMRVHVFGNSPSPAVATYGLHKTAEEAEPIYGSDVTELVKRNFYVDDALTSQHTSNQAVKLLSKTQSALRDFGNLRLHKIASNSEEVLKAFPVTDLVEVKVGDENLQRSLGLIWDTQEDVFRFNLEIDTQPFTRRGVLSLVNSIFDPLGFIAPVTIQGKLLLRKFMSAGQDWDDPFQAKDKEEWESWKNSLTELKSFHIPRTYVDISPSQAVRRELHVFSDASESAIAAVAYMNVVLDDGTSKVGFVIGKSKVAPTHGHTIPRLELCAALMAVEVAELCLKQLDLKINQLKFYTDSKVVLGYIQNEKRRFYVYVTNRVERIRKSSHPDQWNYVPTHLNPADVGTRTLHARELQDSAWICGPTVFLQRSTQTPQPAENFDLVDPEQDEEIRPKANVTVLKTAVESSSLSDLGTHRYERFSTWRKLIEAITLLKARLGGIKHKTVEAFEISERFVIRTVQHEVYQPEIQCLRDGQNLPKKSSILALDPFLDSHGLLRVDGRLRKMGDTTNVAVKHPLILPKRHHVSMLLVRHYHEEVKHMGRHLTEGALRSAGLWIIGGKRLISSMISKCVTCRKLRGKMQIQKMRDLPDDRLEPSPPFSHVGLDTFGPWPVVTRKTRGGQASSKRWAIIFTCLVTRAVHIEIVEEMSSSAFINALRRFIAIRGNVRVLRSDRGTNFVGATDSLRIDSISVEDKPVKDFLYNTGTVWIFNPPHSSHMGGVWERMIKTTRRILDSMLLEMSGKALTHDVLTTLMAEVSSIINARPLVPVSTDPESPQVLSPSTLLTMKSDHRVQSFTLKDVGVKDMYKCQWKQVQYLADRFWCKWKKEYLSTLQTRVKWRQTCKNVMNGDVVLLRDNETHRNEWPMGVVVNAIPSKDMCVRKAEIRV